MAAEMTERRRLILKLVIQAYIETSAPVGSDWSSAVVRSRRAASTTAFAAIVSTHARRCSPGSSRP